MTQTTRAGFLAGLAALAPGAAAAAPIGKPERAQIRFGLSVDSTYMLPEYLAATQTWKSEEIAGDLVSFRGDAECAQALGGDSIDVMKGSIPSLINLIDAGQPVIGFYSGFHVAGAEWWAVPAVKTWNDLRGKVVGISTFGSLTDSLTRYVLTHHGLVPEREVQIAQIGGSAAAYQALKAGRIAAAPLSAPFTYRAQADGMTLLGVQAKEIAPEWPAQALIAKTRFLAENPNTIVRLLRANVKALRLAKADRKVATALFVERLKYTEADAERAYDEAMPTFDERGRLPGPKTMQKFWEIEVQSGAVKAPWPAARYLDPRYIDSFRSWAP